MENQILEGDCLEILKTIPDESIDLTLTSPPYYNARAYTTYPDYKTYLEIMGKVFAQVARVTKEGRFMVVNSSPVIEPRTKRNDKSKRYPIPFDLNTVAQENGWEFMEDIVWIKPEGSVTNRNAKFSVHRQPIAYKPNVRTEYIMVYRKITDKLIDWNLEQYGKEIIDVSLVDDGYERTNCWFIPPVSDKVHTATFPAGLAHRIISYYSMYWDTVLDPFAGVGTTGLVAYETYRSYILIEKDPTYYGEAKQRLANQRAQSRIYFQGVV